MAPVHPVILCLLPCLATTLPAQTKVHHRFAFKIGDAAARITTRVTGWPGGEMVVRMPGWSPAFEPGVRSARPAAGFTLRARVGDAPAEVTAKSPWEWALAASGGAVTLEYDYPLVDPRHPDGLGQRQPHRPKAKQGEPSPLVRYHETFVLRGGTTWLQLPGEHRLGFDLPEGFEVATSLPRDGDGYRYEGFAPVYIGRFETRSFTVGEKPHKLFLAGFDRDRTSREQLVERLTKIVQANEEAMGPLPCSSYCFLIGRRTDRPFGIGTATAAEVVAPTLQAATVLSRNLAAANLAAWDGPCFQPAERGGDPDRRTLSALAWFWLGAREHLTDLALVRAGLATPEEYWTTTVAARINKLRQDGRRLEHTAADTGARMLDPGEIPRGAPHPELVGALLCLLLDVEIRAGSGGKRSLHQVLQSLRGLCAHRGGGYTAVDIENACANAAGRSLSGLLDCATTTKELPLTGTLLKIGIDARPIATEKPREGPQRRPPRWRVEVLPKPVAEVLALREGLTAAR